MHTFCKMCTQQAYILENECIFQKITKNLNNLPKSKTIIGNLKFWCCSLLPVDKIDKNVAEGVWKVYNPNAYHGYYGDLRLATSGGYTPPLSNKNLSTKSDQGKNSKKNGLITDNQITNGNDNQGINKQEQLALRRNDKKNQIAKEINDKISVNSDKISGKSKQALSVRSNSIMTDKNYDKKILKIANDKMLRIRNPDNQNDNIFKCYPNLKNFLT